MAHQQTTVAHRIIRSGMIGCTFTLVGAILYLSLAQDPIARTQHGIGSSQALTQTTFAHPPESGQPASNTGDIFSDIEPGVRLLGKPSPSVALGQILKFAILADNQLISVGTDGVKLWDNEKNLITKNYQFATPITNCCAFEWSSDKELFAISTWSHLNTDPNQAGRVLIFDKNLDLKNDLTFDEADEKTKRHAANQVIAVEFAPNDDAIAIANTISLTLLDLENEEVIQKFSMGLDPARPSRLIFHDNKIHALGQNSKSFDLETGKVSVLSAPLDTLSSHFFSAYDRTTKRLFASERTGVRAINLSDGKTQPIDALSETHPLELSLSLDDSLLAVTQLKRDDRDSSLWLSIVDTKALKLKFQFKDIPSRPTGVQWDESNESIYIAFNNSAGFQKFELDASEIEQKPKYALNKPIQSVALPFDGSRIVSTNITTHVVSRDWTTGDATKLNACNQIYPTTTTDGFFAMHQKGQVLSLVKQQFNKKKARAIQSYSMRRKVAVPLTAYLFGASDQPTSDFYYVYPSSVSMNEANKQVHCVVLDGLAGIRIQSFDLAKQKRTRDQLFKRPATPAPSSPTAITTKGDVFAIAEDGKVKIIEIHSAATLFETDAHKVNQLMFSKSGEWLAMTQPKGVTILETKTGRQLKQIEVPKPLISYAFKSDELVVTSRKSGAPVRIFETDKWQVKFEHATKTSDRVAVSTSHNGKRIAIALSNCCIELWDVNEIAE